MTFYGAKAETTGTPSASSLIWPVTLKIDNSSHIKIYGYSGNAQEIDGQGLIEVTDSANVTMTNLVRNGSSAIDPSKWYHVKVTNNGVTQAISADIPVSLVKISDP